MDSDATVVLSDHGWCATCTVGRCSTPWQDALNEAKSVLSAVGPRLADRLTVERNLLPEGRAKPAHASLRPDRRVGRRDFLQRLAGMAESRDPLAESRRVVFGRGLAAPLKRKQILARLAAIASAEGQDMPAALFPAIAIAEGCDLHGLCAAVCPTGALRRILNDDAVSLLFDSADCIACFECQRVCPGKALSLRPEGDGLPPRGATPLITRRATPCAGCGDNFVPKDDEDFCAACRKTMDLMQEAAALKLGTPAPSR
jgi:ferredoxin